MSGVLRERQWRALRCAGDPPPAAEPAASVSGITGCKARPVWDPVTRAALQAGARFPPRLVRAGREPRPRAAAGAVAPEPGRRARGLPHLLHCARVPGRAAGAPGCAKAPRGAPERATRRPTRRARAGKQVHQFRRTERGWCECLVDVADDGDARHLRMVLAPDTPAARMLLPLRLAGLPPAERARPPAPAAARARGSPRGCGGS